MTYQPLKHKEHFSKTMEVFGLLAKYADSKFSEEELLLASNELLEIGKGKITEEKIKEYAQVANFYSHDTYNMMSNTPWKTVPSCYSYDEETSPVFSREVSTRVNDLIYGVV